MTKWMTRAVGYAAGCVAAGLGLLVTSAGSATAAPNPKPNLPGDVENKLNVVLGMGMAVVIVACVAGVFICAGKMALALRHGEGFEAVKGLAGVGVACVLVGSGAGIVNFLV